MTTPHCAFPHNHRTPACVLKTFQSEEIPIAIGKNLLAPEIRAVFRPPECRALVPMKEAPVDEDRRSVLRKHNVRASGKLPDVQSIPESLGEQESPDQQLRLGIHSPDSRHVSAASLRGVNISHLNNHCDLLILPALQRQQMWLHRLRQSCNDGGNN